MITIDDRELSHERVRLFHAEWSEMLRAIDACARRLEQLGAANQAEALRVDMYYLAQRAERHLKQETLSEPREAPASATGA